MTATQGLKDTYFPGNLEIKVTVVGLHGTFML